LALSICPGNSGSGEDLLVDRRSREGHATACLREEEDKDDFVKSPGSLRVFLETENRDKNNGSLLFGNLLKI
jgi:hypothetical protein